MNPTQLQSTIIIRNRGQLVCWKEERLAPRAYHELLAIFFKLHRVDVAAKLLRCIALLAAMLLPVIPQARTLLSVLSPEQVSATNIWAPLGWSASLYYTPNPPTSWIAFPFAPAACGALALDYCALDEWNNSDSCIKSGSTCGKAAEIDTPGYAIRVCVSSQQVPRTLLGASYPLYHQATNRCFCPQGTTIDQNTAWCMSTSESLLIALTAAGETRPAATGGTSTVTLTAKVTDGTNPKPGVAVSFSVDVTPNSGGHEHHDVARPKGTLSGTQGTTDANGEVKLTFQAPEVAGIHTIKATCATCSNSLAAKELQVKVPNLLPLPPSPPQNADSTFVYALTSVDKTHQGNGRYHVNQYYLTEQSQINLQSMIKAFAKEGWGTVALNDASLFWGGRYDITSNWGAPHAAHRYGREIDISFTRAQNPVSTSKQNDFYDKFCKTKNVQIPFSILHHYVLVPHFHVFLEKQTACFKSGT